MQRGVELLVSNSRTVKARRGGRFFYYCTIHHHHHGFGTCSPKRITGNYTKARRLRPENSGPSTGPENPQYRVRPSSHFTSGGVPQGSLHAHKKQPRSAVVRWLHRVRLPGAARASSARAMRAPITSLAPMATPNRASHHHHTRALPPRTSSRALANATLSRCARLLRIGRCGMLGGACALHLSLALGQPGPRIEVRHPWLWCVAPAQRSSPRAAHSNAPCSRRPARARAARGAPRPRASRHPRRLLVVVVKRRFS